MCGFPFVVKIIVLNKIIICMLLEHAFMRAPSTGEFLNIFFLCQTYSHWLRSIHANFLVILSMPQTDTQIGTSNL